MEIERTTFAPEVLLTLDRAGGGLLRGQLEQALRAAVRAGRLPAGSRLPSTRALAADLGVSRGLVVEAYAQLVGEGYLEARSGSGTRVAGGMVAHPPAAPPGRAAAGEVPGGGLAGGMGIDFRPGVPELAAFPRAAWAAALRRAVLGAPTAALGYGDPAGAGELRTALASYLGRVRGVEAAAAGVLVTAGFAQAVALLARGLPSRLGRTVAVEDPGSPGTRQQLAGNGLEPVPVGVDEEGLRVDELARGPARVVVVTPAHQSPTGVVLSPDRRAALLAWARAADGLIIEDDYDAEYRYDRDPVGALQGLAPELVCYAGSVSKTLAPALRIGWMVPPRSLWPALARAKAADDLGCPTLEQLALADLLGSGAYDRHLRRGRARYRRRRDALAAALDRHVPGLQVKGTAAGLHAVVELGDGVDEEDLVRRAAVEAGVGLHGLTPWRFGGRGAPGLVLGYASLTEHQIAEGVRRVAPLLTGRR